MLPPLPFQSWTSVLQSQILSPLSLLHLKLHEQHSGKGNGGWGQPERVPLCCSSLFTPFLCSRQGSPFRKCLAALVWGPSWAAAPYLCHHGPPWFSMWENVCSCAEVPPPPPCPSLTFLSTGLFSHIFFFPCHTFPVVPQFWWRGLVLYHSGSAGTSPFLHKPPLQPLLDKVLSYSDS